MLLFYTFKLLDIGMHCTPQCMVVDSGDLGEWTNYKGHHELLSSLQVALRKFREVEIKGERDAQKFSVQKAGPRPRRNAG